MPRPGDEVLIDGLPITVESTDGRRVAKVLVARVVPGDDGDPDDDEADR